MHSIGKTTQLLLVLLVVFFYFTFRTHLCFAGDTISSGQSLILNQTLISKGGVFELGFFRPGTSPNYYIGIWYKEVSVRNKTVVWVANRDDPLTDDPTSSELKLLENGNLVLLNQPKRVIWSTELMSSTNVLSEAVLGDDGNLVLRTGVTPSDVVWQSFAYPTDTLLPGARIYNRITKIQQSLTCWRSPNDPGKGLYSLELAGDQFFIQSNRNQYWNSGPWNGWGFSLVPEMGLNSINLTFVRNEEESYFTYSLRNNSILSRLVMDISGQFKQFSWELAPNTKEWTFIWSQPKQQCEVSRYCGAFGVCNQMSLPFCTCLEGFEPRSLLDWSLKNFSTGCVRRTALQCGDEDRFLQVPIVKQPDNQRSLRAPNADGCKLSCLNSCSCSAYSFSGSCLLWDGDLFNLQQFQDGDGAVLSIQIKLAASETPSLGGRKPLKAYIIVLIAGLVFISILVCFLFGYKLKQRGKIKSRETSLAELSLVHATERGKLELPFFDFNTIVKATNNFSNRLGQGGFGSVYKGKLLDEQEIAVKRLSRSSGQGVQEFMNELTLISKLQHRNLVRLLGYCIYKEEKMLVYEYMPNKSLDAFLFDPTREILLDWQKRFNIVDGIARGIMYLHRDSRLKVIHRDLKASNILLDEDMNPKISDFGMARIFGGKQTLANTNRIVGTYGYMSPEYAMEGIFSEKSDVFSFGVLLLEIVSNKKNRKFYFLEESYNLLGYVWQKWNENKVLELMDPTVAEYNPQEFTRCIHIGLLCVQESAHDRPTMPAIVSMLGSEGTLPLPKKPAFTIDRAQISESIFNTSDAISTNSITITNPEGR